MICYKRISFRNSIVISENCHLFIIADTVLFFINAPLKMITQINTGALIENITVESRFFSPHLSIIALFVRLHKCPRIEFFHQG
jgi:hypothetical protein